MQGGSDAQARKVGVEKEKRLTGSPTRKIVRKDGKGIWSQDWGGAIAEGLALTF